MDDFKTFLGDKTMLLMSFVGLLFVGFNVLLVILQVDTTQTVAITSYNVIEGSTFTRGNVRSLYILAVAPVIFYAIQTLLAIRVYHRHRVISIMLLSLNIVILLFSVIVSSAIINVNK